MEKFIVEIDLSKDIFQYNMTENIAKCLDRVSKMLRGGIPSYAVYDVDGNIVGRFDMVSADAD